MNFSGRALVIASLAALVGSLAPTAGATPQLTGGVTLQPLAAGNLWRTGVLFGATMYAQPGSPTTATVNLINVPGQKVVSRPTITTYTCETTSKTIAPQVRAEATGAVPATCTQIGTRVVSQGNTIKLAIPSTSAGLYLAVQETARLAKGSTQTTGITWVETAIYPQNPTAAGPPVSTSPIYAGGPTSYLPQPWRLAAGMTQMAYTSEAWICPDKVANGSTEPLSTIGCNRAFRNINTNIAPASFTLGGRVHRELTQFQYLYYVAYVTVDPDGPLNPQTYQVRSRGRLIKPLPAPSPAYSTAETTITATFNPIDGVTYKMSANRTGTGRQFAAPCLGDATRVVCTLDVLPGQWRVHVTPIGKQAVGTSATTVLVVASA